MISTIFFAPQVELGLQDPEQEDELLFEDEGERRVQLIHTIFLLGNLQGSSNYPF